MPHPRPAPATPAATPPTTGPGAPADRPAERSGSQPPSAVSLPRLLVFLVLVTALSAVDHTIVATALPTVVADLQAPTRASWVLTAYALAMAVSMPVVGSLADRHGRTLVLRLGVVVFVLSSVVCAAAQSVEQLAVARAVQGIGGAAMLVLPQSLVAEVVPARDRAAVLGPLGAVFAVATVAGPLLGGWLTDVSSWRAVFWINLPLGALALGLSFTALRRVRPQRDSSARFDAVGALLLAAATLALAWSATTVPVQGATWASGVALAVTAALVVVVLVHQRRAAAPVLPVAALRGRAVLLCTALAAVVGFGMFGVIAYVPSWVQGVHGTSATTSGLMLLPVTLGIITGVNASGWAVRATGRWRPFPVLGCAVAALAAAVLATVGAQLPLPATAAVLVVLGAGAGSFMTVVLVVAQDASPQTQLGSITATLTFVREAAVTVGTGLLGGLLAAVLASGSGWDPASYEVAFQLVFGVVAAVFAVGVVLAAALPARTLATAP